MILEEGGVRIKDAALFGKYQLSRIIGQGRNSTVYLAVHLGLEEQRVIKRVPKSSVGYEQFRQEALLLKELQHPGIPMVYDIEEDLNYSYLIEEYLEGDSIYDLVKRQGHLSQEAVIRYGIQICSLVHYLHSVEETPILYLDLQPKNLLICHEQVKLIDFDHAARIGDANEASKRYGTLGCCAPEQMDASQTLDVCTDVFAIGCILHFMWKGHYLDEAVRKAWKHSKVTLLSIIQTCTQISKADRYPSVEEILWELEKINYIAKNNISSLIIALVGSKSGVGTTHLSLGLSNYLRKQGYPNLYEEHNHSDAIRQMAHYTGAKADAYGIFKIKNTMLKPRYGSAVRLKEHPYKIVLRDYGMDWDTAASQTDIDIVVLVQGGKWWDTREGERALERWKHAPDLMLLYNHTLVDLCIKAPHGISPRQCFRIPWFANPFMPGIQAESCMKAICKTIGVTRKGGFSLRRFLRNTISQNNQKIGKSE